MAAKDLMFKIAIFDDTKTDLGNIKKNLSELENYALGVSRGVTTAVRSIKEIGDGFKINVPDLTSFAEQIGKIDKALGKKDAFKVKDLEDALNTIKKFGEQLGEVPIKRNALAETINNMSSQVEVGARKMGTATTASLETYRDQLKAASKDIETNIGIIRERINAAFNNGNLTPKGGADLRSLFGFNAAVSDRAVSEFVRGFEGTLTRVQEKLKSYDKSIVNNQYLVGDIGKIKEDLNQLETAVTAVRNGLSSKGILGNMPENTNKQISELTNIIGKLDALEQKLQSFGNGTYPDVMRGFITAVDNAVKQVSEKLRGLDEVQPNMSGPTEAHKANEAAIKGETEALQQQAKIQEELNALIEKRRQLQMQLETEKRNVEEAKTWGNVSNYTSMISNAIKAGGFDLDKELSAFNDKFVIKAKLASSETFKKMREAYAGLSKDQQKFISGNVSITDTDNWKHTTDILAKAIAEKNKQMELAIKRVLVDRAMDNHMRFSQAGFVYRDMYASEMGKVVENSPEYKALKWQRDLAEKMARQVGQYEKGIEPISNRWQKLYNEEQKKNPYSEDKGHLEAIAEAQKRYNAVQAQVKETDEKIATAKQKLTQSTTQQAAANEKLAASQQKVQSTSKTPKELSLNFKEDDLVSPLEKVQQRIRTIIEQISKDVSGGLKDALNTDISSTKTIQQLGELADGLNGLESKLQGASKVAQQLQQVKEQAENIKANLTSAATGGSMATGNNEDKFTANINQLVRNQDTIDLLITKLKKAKQDADSARERITKNGGDTKDIDKYTDKLENLINILGRVRNQYSLLNGNKGMMMIPQNGAIKDLADFVTLLTNKNYSTPADLMAAVKELTTPSGAVSRTLMAEANSFTAYAKQLEAAARARETTMSNLERRKILSDSLVDITKGSDLRSALARFNTITPAQEGVAYNQSSLKKSIEDIIAFKNKIDALSEAELNQKGKVANLQAEYNKLTNIYRKHLSQYNQLLAAYEKSNNTGVKLDTASLTMAENKIASLTFAIKEYDKTIQSASQLNLQGDKATALSDIEVYVQRLRDALSLLIELRENALAGKGAKTDAGLDARSVLSKYNVGANEIWARNYNKELKKEIKASQGSVTDLQTEANRAFSAITNQITRMDKTMRDGLKFNVDTSKLEASMQVLRQYQQELEAVAKAGGNLNGKTAKMVTADPGYVAAMSQAKMEQTAVAANVATKKEAEQANKALANSENTVAQAIANTTGAARGQSQVLSDLKSMAAQYLSVWGAQQFISDMTHITGELELQERSLEVILGNASAAREMYSQIRDLSQMSPYTFEDLLKSQRQLAAFGIEAKDIFGTLKSLSDIGAGLDVDVSRLILAYGHTKSYGYLSGIQNRQFETAGIDLVGSLTDLYNKRADENKKLGINADYVTRTDIFKKMRDRSIPFSDVQEVIMDLDKPGGKFYNMQIKQYDTLGGKLRNLKNNYRIMMSEIGESNHGLIAGSVDMINELTANWSKYGRVLKGVAYGYAAMKLAALAAGRSVMAANRQIYRTAATTRASNVANAYLNNPTSSWWRPNMSAYTVPVSKDMSNAEFRNLKTSKEINNLTKQRIALTGALNTTQREELLVQTGVNRARAAEIAGFPAWKRGLMSIRLGLIQAGQAAKAFTLSLLTNPMTWIFAAVGIFTSIKSKLDEASESARSFAENLRDAAKTDQEGIRQSLDEYGELAKAAEKYNTYRKKLGEFNDYWGVDNKNVDDGREYLAEKYSSDISSFKAEAEARGIENVFEDLRKKLETQSPFYAGDYFDIMKANNELDQLANMFDKYRTLQKVKGMEEKMSPEWERRNADSTGEGFQANAKDFADSRKQFVELMQKGDIDYWSRLTEDEKQKITAYANGVGEALKDTASKNRAIAGWFAQNGTIESVAKLQKVGSYDITGAFRKLRTGNSGIFGSQSYKDDFRDSAEEIAKGFVSDFKNSFANDADGMSEYFTDILNKQFSDAKVADPEDVAMMTDEMIDVFYQQLGNSVNADDKKQFFTQQAQGILGDLIQKNMVGKIDDHMADKDIDAVVKNAVAQAIKTFKEQYPKLAAILKALGINLDKQLEQTANNIADKMVPSKYWQRRAISMHIEVNPQMDVDYTEFIKGQRKALKEAEDILNANKKKIQYTLGIQVAPDFEFGSPKKAREILDKLTNKRMQLTREKLEKLASNPKANTSDIDGALEFIDTMVSSVNKTISIMEYLDSEHQSYSDDKGGKDEDKAAKQREAAQRAAEKAKNERERRMRAEDKSLIRGLENRRKAMTQAFKVYWDWYEKLGKDNEAAMEKVRQNLKESRLVFPAEYDINSISNIDSINEIYRKEQAYVKKQQKKLHYNDEGNQGSINNILSSYQTDIDQNRQKQFEDSAKNYTSELDLQIKRLEKQYDLYKKIYELTGDRSMALTLSGRQGDTLDTSRSKAADIQNGIQSSLNNKITELNNKGGLQLAEKDIDFQSVSAYSDEEIKAYVGQLINRNAAGNLLSKDELKQVQPLIEAITKQLIAWRDLQEQINNESKETTANIIGNLKNYGTLVDKIKQKYDDLNAKIKRQGYTIGSFSGNNVNGARKGGELDPVKVTSGYLIPTEIRDKADRANLAEETWELFKITPEFQNLINKSVAIPLEELKKTAMDALQILQLRFEEGTISPDEYAKQKKDITDALATVYRTAPQGSFFSFMQGGMAKVYSDRAMVSNAAALDNLRKIDQQNGIKAEAEKNYKQYEKDYNNAIENGDNVGAMQAKLNMMNAKAQINTSENVITDLKKAFSKNSDDADKNTEKSEKETRRQQQIDAVIKAMQALQSALSLLSNTFDALGLGDTAAGQAVSDATDVMGGMLQGASSLSALGPYGMAAGAALGLIGGLAGVHDKHQQKKIDQLQEDVSAIEGYTQTIAKAQERTLGYDYGDIIRSYQKQYALGNMSVKTNMLGTVVLNMEGAAGKAMSDYYNSAGAGLDLSGYQQQYNMLVQKRKDYIGMYNAENGKKKKSKSALQDYKDKIADLDDQIKFFGQDLAKNLWDIDLKSWADQLGDALMSAFENGENAAKAFDDSVRSILQGVFSKMLKLQILEPMFKNLQDKLFGNKDNGTQGVFNPNDIVGSSQKVAQVITDFFGTNGEGRNTITAARQFYNGVNLGLSNAGLTLDNDSSSTLSSGISSASEDSVNVFSGYVASLRQDVSIIRLQDSMFYNETLPDYIKTVTAGVSSLQNIDTNVQAIRMLMSENGSLYEQIRTLRDDVHGIVTQQKSVRMA